MRLTLIEKMKILKQKKPIKAYEISEDTDFSVGSHMRKCKCLEMSLRWSNFCPLF